MSQLPISNLLAEASPDSLSELFSRDPESGSPEDDDKIILELRAMRERYQQAEQAGIKTPKAAKMPAPLPTGGPGLRI